MKLRFCNNGEFLQTSFDRNWSYPS